jgi:hypothetical protein
MGHGSDRALMVMGLPVLTTGLGTPNNGSWFPLMAPGREPRCVVTLCDRRRPLRTCMWACVLWPRRLQLAPHGRHARSPGSVVLQGGAVYNGDGVLHPKRKTRNVAKSRTR